MLSHLSFNTTLTGSAAEVPFLIKYAALNHTTLNAKWKPSSPTPGEDRGVPQGQSFQMSGIHLARHGGRTWLVLGIRISPMPQRGPELNIRTSFPIFMRATGRNPPVHVGTAMPDMDEHPATDHLVENPGPPHSNLLKRISPLRGGRTLLRDLRMNFLRRRMITAAALTICFTVF